MNPDIAMNPEQHAESGGPSEQPIFLIKEMLPVDLFVYIGNFLKVEDYANFIRGLWPDHDEDEMIRKILWKKSTYRLFIDFINGKTLEVEYNYDCTRADDQRVLINVNTLLPVFGGQVPPDGEAFMNVKKLNAFVDTYVHLDECQDYNRASCPCHLDLNPEDAGEFERPVADGCANNHFHHYCSQHVIHWLLFVVEPTIKAVEEGSFDEDSTADFVYFLDNVIYFNDAEILFRSSNSFSSDSDDAYNSGRCVIV